MKGFIKKLFNRFEHIVNNKIISEIIKFNSKHKFLNDTQIKDFTSRCIVYQFNTYVSKDSKIGDYTYLGFNTSVSKSNIGRYCSIANNVSIGDGEHDINEISTSSLFYSEPYLKLTEKDCQIGNDVWIGVDSIIRRGTKIGNGAIIGANSFVNKDIPDFAIAVGSPAKVIKYRFGSSKIDSINNAKWWNLDYESAKKQIIALNNINNV